MDQRPRVGFLGLGLMGGAMSRVLLEEGFPLRVFDLNPARIDELVALGAEPASSPADVAKNVQIVCGSLPDGRIVRDVYLGSGQVLANLAPGSLVMDFSTTEPAAIRDVHAGAAPLGIGVLDTPVSGGPPDIPRRERVVLVGTSDEHAFEQGQPILQALSGGRIHRTGDVGTARVVKLVNNTMSLGNVLVAAEAFTMGVKAGVDPQLLFDVLSQSGGRSAHFQKRFPWALQRDFEARFSMSLGIKDVRLALGLGQEVGSPMPAAAMIVQLFAACAAEGHGAEDMVAVLQMFEKWAGTEADARAPVGTTA